VQFLLPRLACPLQPFGQATGPQNNRAIQPSHLTFLPIDYANKVHKISIEVLLFSCLPCCLPIIVHGGVRELMAGYACYLEENEMRRNQSVWTRLFGGLVMLALLVLPLQNAGALTVVKRYAKPNGKNTGACTSWAIACNLQRALAQAQPGNQVWVAKGTYKPGTFRTDTFILKNGVAVYGGFVVGGSFGARKPAVNKTILSGDIGTVGNATDNSFHVVTGSGTDGTAVLDGFIIQSGYAVNGLQSSQLVGGGMYSDSGSPTLRNLVFQLNTAYNQGGGMYNWNSSPSLTNVTFQWNSGGTIGGGGMYNDNSSPQLNGVTFNGNSAGTDGGGMYNNNFTGPSNPVLNGVTFIGNTANYGAGLDNRGSNPTLTNVTFSGNAAANYGGGMFNNAVSSPDLTNVTFSGNTAANGGGMYNNDGSEPTALNVTFSANTASASGDGIYDANSSPVLENSILWGDGTTEVVNDATSLSTITDSIVSGGCPSADATFACNNVLTTDPVLGALAANGGSTQTRWLGAGSAAIDAGGVNVACATTDQRGTPRTGKCDMGAFEVRTLTYVSQAASDGYVTESFAGSGVGGSFNAVAASINVGDNLLNRQSRAVLSFNTGTLPDGATVVLAKARVLPNAALTGDPFGALGALLIDIQKPYFDGGLGLSKIDFQALGVAAGGFDSTPDGSGWYNGTLNAPLGLAKVNKTGTTQLRMRFSTATNFNNLPDYLSFFSGNAAAAANRPTLTIYYVP
jgi:hypothetical protein